MKNSETDKQKHDHLSADHDDHAEKNDHDAAKNNKNSRQHGQNAADGHKEQKEHSGHQEDKEHGGHGGHEHHSPKMFQSRFWLSLILTIPVLAYSHHIQMWFSFTPPKFPGSGYVPFVLGTIIFFYGGWVFLKGGLQELKARKPGMMTLISLAISVAFFYSFLVTLGLPGEELYWELATLVTIMLLGHWLEMSAVQGAKGALNELAKLLPDKARRIDGDSVEEVPVSKLSTGDLVMIRPGEQIPSDGEVEDGISSINESMVTGESMPVKKEKGDTVIAGTVNEDGSLRVRVKKTGEDTVLAGIMRLVEQAQASSSRGQALADKAAFWLVVIALGAAITTALVWSTFPVSSTFILERVVTVLIIACPHALGLAIPLVIAISTTLSAKNGLLVKDRLAMEQARDINCVVFDKTGTLTKGDQAVASIHGMEGISEDTLLELAAAAESDSEHTIARAVLQAAEKKGLNIPKATSFKSLPGIGISAKISEQEVFVGGPNLLTHLELSLEQDLQEQTRSAAEGGQSILFIVVDGRVQGYLVIADEVRQESYEAVSALREKDIRVVMLTGDSEAVAKKVSRELGIDQYFAEVLPENKTAKIESLRQEGYFVAMVGDGVNDAPALAAADVGIAIGAGTDVAVASADIVLVRNDPRDVLRLLRLSKATYGKMIQNLGWAVGYNVLALPLAAGVLAPIGFILPMAVGAIVMSASTIIVALNAQLLRRLDLTLNA